MPKCAMSTQIPIIESSAFLIWFYPTIIPIIIQIRRIPI